MTVFLELEDLVALRRTLGGLVVRDVGLLDDTAQRPASTLYGRDAYPTIHEKAAVQLESLSRNHALVDGNKRIAWLAIFVFYGLNEFDLDAPDDGAYELVIAVSTGAVDYSEAAARLSEWARPVTPID